MENAVTKILKGLIVGIVTWAISNALFDVLFSTIDNAIASSGDNVSGILKALKTGAGLLMCDSISFALGLIVSIMLAFEYKKEQ
jgi:hypothetical protein